MIHAADTMCDRYLKVKTLTEKWNPGEVKSTFDRVESEVTGLQIVAFVEVNPGSVCEWKADVNHCKTEFRKIIDECDTNGENRKQGERLVGDCLTWRLDPNSDL